MEFVMFKLSSAPHGETLDLHRRSRMQHWIRVALLLTLALGGTAASAADLATSRVQAAGGDDVYVTDGVVEAVRQTVIAAQVPGRITALPVKAGDAVKSGQTLARIDQRAAVQQAAVSQAQVTAARAQLDVAEKEYERSQRLYRLNYISLAAMDQAEAQYKATAAQVRATLAQAGWAATQTTFNVLEAPYAGVLADVSAQLGDMAMPGKALMTVYDPSALRVVVNLPESYLPLLKAGAPVKLEFSGAADKVRWQIAQSVTILPTADPSSHTVEVRLDLPAHLSGLTPGMFARAYFPTSGTGTARLSVPATAVVKRTELYAVYVIDPNGKSQLRQVRIGKSLGDRVEVLAGLQVGERVALDPLAAAKR
jgi:membrane fusion protein, multidrug efflux system